MILGRLKDMISLNPKQSKELGGTFGNKETTLGKNE
jgi:hypothetical protein